MWNRRDILVGGLGVAAVGAGAWALSGRRAAPPSATRGLCLGSGRYRRSDGSEQLVFTMLDLDRLEVGPGVIPTDFLPHGIVLHPRTPQRVLLFEKKGPGACEVDLLQGGVVRTVDTEPTQHFYGHGAWSADASLLYATEAVLDGKSGVVAVRDGQTMARLGTFPTYGHSPHDCRLIDDGRVLVITNGGGDLGSGHRPNVAYVDVQSEALLDQVVFDNERINAGHLGLSDDKDLVVVSAPRDGLDKDLPGAISFRPLGGEVIPMKGPEEVLQRMTSETLSLALHEPTHVVAATNPAGDLVTFWDYRTGTLVGSLPMDDPRSVGVTLDGEAFVIGHGADASLSFVDVHTLQVTRTVPNAGFSGSHLLLLDKRRIPGVV